MSFRTSLLVFLIAVPALPAAAADCVAVANAAANKCLSTSGPVTPAVITKCSQEQDAAGKQCQANAGGNGPASPSPPRPGSPPGTAGPVTPPPAAAPAPAKPDPAAQAAAAARAKAKAKADAIAAGKQAYEAGVDLFKKAEWDGAIAKFSQAAAKLREGEDTRNAEIVDRWLGGARCEKSLQDLTAKIMPRYQVRAALQGLGANPPCAGYADARIKAMIEKVDTVKQDDILGDYLKSETSNQSGYTRGGQLLPLK